MKAIILAGGFGTRLKSITGENTPKPMVSIAGKPFLEHQINFLKDQGVTEIILTVHHMANQIKSYFGTGGRLNVNITYAEEDVPLGTAGAIKNAEKYIDGTFLVLNGDSYSQINLKDLMEFHKSKKGIVTMSLTKTKDSSRYGSVSVSDGKVINFSEKGIQREGLINSGVYVFEPEIFSYIPKDKNISLEKEIFSSLIKEEKIQGYEYEGYFMDIGIPETYKKFKEDALTSLFLREDNTLRDALQKINKSEIDLILVVDNNRKLLGVITDRRIKKHLLSGGELRDCLKDFMIKDPIIARNYDSDEKISKILLTGIRKIPILNEQGEVVDVHFMKDRMKKGSFPIVRGRTPLRISFAGGGTDLPNFFEKYGGVVINTTIDKYCYATIIKRADSKIIINSDLGEEVIINFRNELVYDGQFNLIKSIINLMKPHFGFEIYLHNDLPPGRGLGSSASAAVLVASLLANLMHIKYGDYKIAEIAHQAETKELGIKGGWQDQYAAVTGGFNFMEFNKDKSIIYPLRLKEEVINELNHHLMLCYVGKEHSSSYQQQNLDQNILRGEEEVNAKLNELKEITLEIKDCLLTNEIEKIGELLHKSWENKKKLSNKMSDPQINSLYEIGLKNGARGGKLLGSGGGGYILFFHSPKKRNQLKKALEDFGGEVMNFKFEFDGTKIWTSEDKN